MAELDRSSSRRMKNRRGIAEVWQGYGSVISNNVFSQFEILSVALGRTHGLFLTAEHQVYSFGSGDNGASLGLGSCPVQTSEPALIYDLLDTCVVDVICGPEQSGAISDDGKLFMWGENSQGQCGQPSEQAHIASPMVVPLQEHLHVCTIKKALVWQAVHVVQASCGEQHTLAVTQNGELWTWGTGIQLGIKAGNLGCYTPCKITSLKHHRVLSAVCGLQHSLAISTALDASALLADNSSSPKMASTVSECKTCKKISQDSLKSDLEEECDHCPLGLALGKQSEECDQLQFRGSHDGHSNVKQPKDKRTKELENTANGRLRATPLSPIEVVQDTRLSENEENFLHLSQVSLTVDGMLTSTPKHSDLESNVPTSVPDTLYENPPSPLFDIGASETVQLEASHCELKSSSGVGNCISDSVALQMEMSPEKPVKLALNAKCVNRFLEKSFSSDSKQTLDSLDVDESTSPGHHSSSPALKVSSKEFSFVLEYGWRPNTTFRDDDPHELELISRGSNDDESLRKYADISDSCENFSYHGIGVAEQNCKKPSKVASCDRVDALHDPMNLLFDHGKSTLANECMKEMNYERCCWQTEVWSWGKNSFGQLGLGDSLDREFPVCVRQLNNMGVVKVVAGDAHNMAVTIAGHVYAWGSNLYGQLAAKDENEQVIYSPQAIKISDKAFVWDLAAGSKCSMILLNQSGDQEIHFCGKQEGLTEVVQSTKASSWVPHHIQTQDSKIRQVIAGGPFNCCIIDRQNSGHLSTLYELAITELQFFRFLDNLATVAVEPILQNDTLAQGCGTPLQLVFQSFLAIAKNSAQNGHRLRYLIQNPSEKSVLPLFHDVEHQLSIYQTYCHYFCDALAINGFERCIKVAQSVFKTAANNLRHFISEDIPNDVISPEILQHLLEEPIRHMTQYKKLFFNLGQQHTFKDWLSRWELSVAQKWKELVTKVTDHKQESEHTRAFWDACPPKIAESLKEPSRRIVRDSKTSPVNLLNAGRFSSHWFILFNDALVHSQYSGLAAYDLSTVWVDPAPDLIGNGNTFSITLPEDNLTLVCDTTYIKTEWICSLNDAINAKLKGNRGRPVLSSVIRRQPSIRRTPPLRRHAKYTFSKLLSYKEATYCGVWFNGQMHGQGEITWPDCSKYVGCFSQNKQDGYGTLILIKSREETIFEGLWKNGKLNGLGSLRYPNGDLYEGYFKDGLCHGHGVLKRGQLSLSSSSIYIGQWMEDKRQGYGVMDDIGKGEKYMGMWHDDYRHGKGMLVTLDGIYFEGNFVKGQIGGFGLMYDNRSWYGGEVGPERTFNGKGILTLASGEVIEGNLSGSWNDGIKINGILTKSTLHKKTIDFCYPRAFSTLCVEADDKWTDIFQQCYQLLGIKGQLLECTKAWEALAILITNWKRHYRPKRSRQLQLSAADLSILERIPPQEIESGPFTMEKYLHIKTYLIKAFDTPYHPLGKLMDGMVDVYRATYVGIGAHPCLLLHAVEEVHSLVSRINDLIRVLFPRLPAKNKELLLDSASDSDPDAESNSGLNVVTAEGLLLPIFLPKIYPPLFTLYVLRYEDDDNLYWDTLMKWNKQPDLALMSFLAIDGKFWFTMKDSESLMNNRTSMSTIRNCHYVKAIDTLQQMSTMFSPLEKLLIVQKVFEEINHEVQAAMSSTHVWTMDDLFPVFQYVVVRACIRHLGSEIHMIDDLMEKRLQNGELGMMFTMLKSSIEELQLLTLRNNNYERAVVGTCFGCGL